MRDPARRTDAASSRAAANGGPAPETLVALQRRLAQSQRLAALGALVARLAHELGTPLHSITGHLDLMLVDPELPSTARQRTQTVAGEVRRLSQLIRRYLERLRTPDPDPVETDLEGLVVSVLDVLDPVLSRRGIALHLDFDGEARAPIRCDRNQVEQVIVNLVQNAVDAMPGGGALVIRTTGTGSGRAISVCDSGHGVAPEHIDHVFDPFFSTKESGRGSGLGLAICREIARAHGGDIRLDSKPGEGTIVTMTIEPITASETPA